MSLKSAKVQLLQLNTYTISFKDDVDYVREEMPQYLIKHKLYPRPYAFYEIDKENTSISNRIK